MTDSFVAISEDGVRFKLKSDGTWEPDVTPNTEKERIRFRSSSWGDSPDKVQASEPDPLDWFRDRLNTVNDVSVAGSVAACNFKFIDGMLCQGVYYFNDERRSSSDRICHFDQVHVALTDKYGAAETWVEWVNDRYRSDPAKRDMAITAGHCTEYCVWTDPETRLSLMITGDKDGVSSMLNYTSIRLQSLAAAARKQELSIGL